MVLDILAIILFSLAALGAVTLVTVGLLTLGFLVDWFRDRAAQVTTDPSKLAVTVAEDIRSGNVSYVQGIFDTDNETFTDVRRIEANDVDSDIQQAHARHKVTIWK
jgi:hypothetical protein